MQRALVIALLLGVVGGYAFAQIGGTASSRAQNLRDCIDGFETCNRSLLTSAQASQVANLQHEQNLWVCLTGIGECATFHAHCGGVQGGGYAGAAAECSRL